MRKRVLFALVALLCCWVVNVSANSHITPNMGVIMIGSNTTTERYDLSVQHISKIYRMLTTVYNVPKGNIMVALVNDNPEENYNYPYNGELYTINYDIDGDNVNETMTAFTSATRAIDSFAQNHLNEVFDQLFMMIDTDGIPVPVGTGDIHYLPIDDNPSSIRNALSNINTSFYNVLSIGSCSSHITCPGLYVSTYIDEVSISDDEHFLRQQANIFINKWVSALSGIDIETGEVVNADYNGDEYISMKEAYDYVQNICHNDCYNIYQGYYPRLMNLLAFDYTPQLYSNLKIRQTLKNDSIIAWNSPDIWIRNQDDGEINQGSESITVTSTGNNTKYIYAKVWNRGVCKNEDYLDDEIHFYWSNPILSGNTSIDESYIGSSRLTHSINGGEYQIVKYAWNLPTSLLNSSIINGGIVSIDLFAQVNNDEIIKNKNTILDVNKGTLRWEKNYFTIYKGVELPIYLNNLTSLGDEFNIEIVEGTAQSNNIKSKTKTSIELSNPLYRAWQYGGSVSTGFTADSNNNKKLNFSIGDATLSSIQTTSSNDNFVLHCYHLLNASSPTTQNEEFHILLKNSSGEIVDGSSFRLTTIGYNDTIGNWGTDTEYGEINPGIGIGIHGNNIILNAQNISVPVNYSWLDEEHNIISTDCSLTISEDNNNNTYLLYVNSTEDNTEGFASIDLSKINLIKRIWSQNGNATIQLLKASGIGLTATATNIQNGSIQTISVASDVNEFTISNLESGIYIISLIQDNKILDSVQIKL